MRFDVAWIFGGISERPSQLVHCSVQAVFKVHERSLTPNLLP
jgi:hypothetical protein